MSLGGRRRVVGRAFVFFAFGAIALIGATACSGSNGPPPPSVTPSGVGSGAHVGGWITGSYTVDEAHKQVDQYFGQTTQLPRSVPPGLALKAIWLMPPPSPGLQIERLDYYLQGFVPPTAAGQDIPPNASHIQVQAFNHEGTESGPSTLVDIGLPGYSATVQTPSAAGKNAVGDGTGGVYHISGHGLSWTIEVWPSSSPSQADLMKFLKGIPPK